MVSAKHGDRIQVHYRILLDDGSQFGSTSAQEPVELKIGQEKLHRACEEAMIGMEVGDSKTVAVSSDRAFGPYLQEKVIEVARDQIMSDVELYRGQTLRMMGCSHRAIIAKVIDFSESSVTLDTNHPLAGKNLIWELTLVAIL